MRSIPTITKNLLIINVLAFLAYYVMSRTGVDLNNLLGLHFFMASDFRIYQLFTYMFMHANLTHIFFNMFALWMFGCVIENVWGPKKFLFYYISCGIGAGLMQELVQYIAIYMDLSANGLSFSMVNPAMFNGLTTVGASGAIYGILLAFGMLFPEQRLFIFPLPVPIKAKWFVLIYAGLELFMALQSSGDGVAHFAHLGGMFFGFLLIRYWRRHPDGNSYLRGGSESPIDKFRSFWEKHSHKKADDLNSQRNNQTSHETDWEYNARKKAEQEEIDRILDKIRRSGYDSLTAEEKRKLFDNSNRS
ncbi:MAG: rhomboid family intramembrane serine protease [Prevotella sp.]|nr:rhomboid family intramembrane serine protease [Prevotella sp.]